MKLTYKNKWPLPLLLILATIIAHLFVILYSLYKTFIGFDIYPSIGLLTYSMLSIGMYISVLLLMRNKNRFSMPLFVLSGFVSVFIFSDLFIPGILLSTWRYTSAIAVSVGFFALLNHISGDKKIIPVLSIWALIISWILILIILLFEISHSMIYGIAEILLICLSCLVLTFSVIKSVKKVR